MTDFSTQIAVMMSTYNPDERLMHQVESILNQYGVKAELFIRDDGSNDAGKKQLRLVEKRYQQIHVIYGENLGYRDSFLQLIQMIAGYKYYAFADQDDFWYPNKLEKMLQMMETDQDKDSEPKLVLSNGNVVRDDKTIGDMYPKNSTFDTISDVSFRAMYGMSFLINDELIELVRLIVNKKNELVTFGHDDLIAFIASLYGKIDFCGEKLMDYVQHSNNASGFKGQKLTLLSKFRLLMKRFSDWSFRVSSNLLSISAGLEEDTQNQQSLKIKSLVLGAQRSIRGRIKLIFSGVWRTHSLAQDFVMFILVIIGKF